VASFVEKTKMLIRKKIPLAIYFFRYLLAFSSTRLI